jgi:hypothetical protein
MPGKQHMSGRSSKENRMYEHIKESEKGQGRSTGRAKEIAARTVNKYHSSKGHSKGK